MPIKTDELKGENCQFPLMIDITGIYTVKETAGILKMSPRNVQRWIDEGKIRAFKLGREWRIHGEDLQALINEARGKS
jgi:excisionase family DNA binding protein